MMDIRRHAPVFMGLNSGDKVLDVCCGTGDQVFYYSSRGALAYGIDADVKMIGLAKSDKRKNDHASFQVGNATKLPFEDGYFDYASISLALHEKERDVRDLVISEIKRVVKKGGGIVFIDFQAPMPGNIHSYIIKMIEFFAGKDHFRCFNDYMKQGGFDRK